VLINLSYDKEFETLWSDLETKYPARLFEIDGVGRDQLDMARSSKEYFSRNKEVMADISVDANANVSDRSVVSYDTEIQKPFQRLNSYYMLWKYARQYYGTDFANMIVEGQLAGDFYINDFHHFFTRPYCFNYSTYDVALQGLPYIDRIKCIPPKHLLTFKQQMEQFTVFASNNQSGASGQADLLIIMSHYVERVLKEKSDLGVKFDSEEDVWHYVSELLTSYVYTINQPFRSNQSAFVNISLYDKYFLEKLCQDIYFEDGTKPNIEITQKLQKIYLEVMNKELERTPITFPVTTACFSVNEDRTIKDKEFRRLIAKYNLRWGFINIFTGDSSTLSSCCRLRSQANNEYFNSFGAGSTKIGSLGVVTLNMARAALKTNKNKERFLKEVERLTEIACKINNVKRHILRRRIEDGYLPLYTYGYMDLSKQYFTTGLNGLNEAIKFMGEDILKEEGQNLQKELINRINKTNDYYSAQYKAPINCEQTPSENSAVKLAEKDRLLGYQNEVRLYSNQFIPLTTKADMLDRIRLQGMFDNMFSGGAICHLNIEERIDNPQIIEDLIDECAEKGVVYFAINYNLQECANGHMDVGHRDKCVICGADIINDYTRIVGFLTNTKHWNRVRREYDAPFRQFYTIAKEDQNAPQT
jgi:anaerobic ribonucleoside-triphosphate reductase